MAESAGYSGLIKVGSTTTYGDATTVNKVVSVSPSISADKLDTSYIGGGQYKTSIQGMKDLSVSIELNLDTADTGQETLRSRQTDGVLFYLWVLPNGSAGFRYALRSFEDALSVATSELNNGSMTFYGQGAPVAYP